VTCCLCMFAAREFCTVDSVLQGFYDVLGGF
jgi:hypothetical protein